MMVFRDDGRHQLDRFAWFRIIFPPFANPAAEFIGVSLIWQGPE
jgi:hypothetical protein